MNILTRDENILELLKGTQIERLCCGIDTEQPFYISYQVGR